MSKLRDELVTIIRDKALRRFPEPVALASGGTSSEFVDVKAGLAYGSDLHTACSAILEVVDGLEFEAVGGLTMGADQFAHGLAVIAGYQWFVVRKEPKGRGTDQLVEGAAIDGGTRVLLVEDTVTTGGSIQKAYDVITGLGADVVGAVTCVDRGDIAGRFFADRTVPYFALVTYEDLGIAPIE